MTPDAALRRLLEGNAVFVAGELRTADIRERRSAVAASQSPFAMVLCCADSRVAPVYIFDQGIGDLFVCRVAGNVIDALTLGSFEFAVQNFKSAVVLLVLGHQRCGAVDDAVSCVASGNMPSGNVGAIVNAIVPAVRATPRAGLPESEYREAVVRRNAQLVAREIVSRSEIVADAVAAKSLRVVAACYSLDTGKVQLLDG